MYKIKNKKQGRSLKINITFVILCSSTIQWPQCKVTEMIFNFITVLY